MSPGPVIAASGRRRSCSGTGRRYRRSAALGHGFGWDRIGEIGVRVRGDDGLRLRDQVLGVAQERGRRRRRVRRQRERRTVDDGDAAGVGHRQIGRAVAEVAGDDRARLPHRRQHDRRSRRCRRRCPAA